MRFTNQKTLALSLAIGFVAAVLVGVFAPVHAQTSVTATPGGSWSCTLSNAPWQQGVTNYTNWMCTNGNAVNYFEIVVPPNSASTWFSDEAAALVAQLSAQAALAAPTPGTPIMPTAPVVAAPPSPPSAIVTQFQADYLLLGECQTADSHLGTITDTFCASQLAKVQNEYTANESTLLPYVQVGP